VNTTRAPQLQYGQSNRNRETAKGSLNRTKDDRQENENKHGKEIFHNQPTDSNSATRRVQVVVVRVLTDQNERARLELADHY
jgi:hypothetical protein